MNLTKTSLPSKFYCWTYGINPDKLPVNFCNFFWAILFAMSIFPLTASSLIVGGFIPYLRDKTKWNWFGRCAATIPVAMAIFLGVMAIESTSEFLFALAAIIIGVPGLVGLVLLIMFSVDRTEDTRKILSEKIRSTKENYCPRISWK